MGTFMKIVFLFFIVTSGISVAGLSGLCQQDSVSDEMAADEYGIYHVVISDESEKEAFSSQIPKGAKVVYHDATELRDSFKIARDSGKFDVLDAEVSTEELFKNSPPLDPNKLTENFDGTHHTHCSGGETVSTWWNRGGPARPGIHAGVEDHVYIIYQQDAHPWLNYVLVRNWGSKCTMEAYLQYARGNGFPDFRVRDWSCDPPPTGDCAGQVGVGACNEIVLKTTLTSQGYIANVSDGVHTFPVIYVVVNEFYVPDENATYPYNNEVWLYRFSVSRWVRVHQRYHNTRPLIGTSGQDRAFWIEYQYDWFTGPGCTGETHPNFGFINYMHCRSPDGKNGSCNWYQPINGDSFVSNDANNPVTIRHVVPNYSFHVTKP
jgi:hypothetical protein